MTDSTYAKGQEVRQSNHPRASVGWLLVKFMALWVVPFQSDKKLGRDLGDIIKGGVKLDFVPIREYKEKDVLWDGEEHSEEEISGDKMWNLVKQQQVPLLGMFVALSSALWLMGGSALLLFQVPYL